MGSNDAAGQQVCTLEEVCRLDREALRMQALRDQIFLKGQIPWWVAAIGYTFFGIVAIVVIPFLYPPAKW
jgi:hypothetical protein